MSEKLNICWLTVMIYVLVIVWMVEGLVEIRSGLMIQDYLHQKQIETTPAEADADDGY